MRALLLPRGSSSQCPSPSPTPRKPKGQLSDCLKFLSVALLVPEESVPAGWTMGHGAACSSPEFPAGRPLSEWAGSLASVRYQMTFHERDAACPTTGTPRNLVCVTKSPADGEADRPRRPFCGFDRGTGTNLNSLVKSTAVGLCEQPQPFAVCTCQGWDAGPLQCCYLSLACSSIPTNIACALQLLGSLES
jgi:hypothetical protein